MRRRPGLGALQSRAADEHAAQRVGASLSASAAAHTEAQLAAFRVHLDGFARKRGLFSESVFSKNPPHANKP